MFDTAALTSSLRFLARARGEGTTSSPAERAADAAPSDTRAANQTCCLSTSFFVWSFFCWSLPTDGADSGQLRGQRVQHPHRRPRSRVHHLLLLTRAREAPSSGASRPTRRCADATDPIEPALRLLADVDAPDSFFAEFFFANPVCVSKRRKFDPSNQIIINTLACRSAPGTPRRFTVVGTIAWSGPMVLPIDLDRHGLSGEQDHHK